MEEGCPIYFYLGRFIWGCLNGENNMKPHSRLKDIHFFFYAEIKTFCGIIISKMKRKNYSKKRSELAATADIFGRSK